MLRLLLVQLFMLFHLLGHGQQKDTLFNRICISAGENYRVGSSFHPNWENNRMVQLQVGVNYLKGNIMLSAQGANVVSKANTYPDFRLFYFTAGYDFHKQVFRNIYFTCALSAGNAWMLFDDNQVPENLQSESELVVILNPQLLWKWRNRFGVAAGYQWNRIYTQPRMDMQFAGFQVRYYFNTPKRMLPWLE